MEEKTVLEIKEPEIKSFSDFWKFLKEELKPKGKIFTPFNVITFPIMIVGYICILIRLIKGLGYPVTNLSQEFPWGLWIGFDVVTGVAFAGGGYVLAFIVYILRDERFYPILRPTILNAFLAYVFYAGAIVLDIGRWWNIYNPMVGNYFGYNSVMFLVAWHFFLYMLAAFIEISPAIAEWLGLRRLRKILGYLTLGAVIFGIALSTLHQSGLGALMMMAKNKIHPLWYTEFIPILYFISSIFAGLSLVIFEGSISHKVFEWQIPEEYHKAYPGIVFSLAKICALVMWGYLFIKLIVLIHDRSYPYLNSTMGFWYLTEVIGFVLIPAILYAEGYTRKSLLIIKCASILTLIGIIINRLNYTFIAYNWFIPLAKKYWPTPIELSITASIILTEIWVFRWIVNRMPVVRPAPAWARKLESH